VSTAETSNVVQLHADSVDLDRLVHMTVTEGSDEAGWTVRCRQPCRFQEGTFPSQHDARKVGNEHIASTLPAPEKVALSYDDFVVTLERYSAPHESPVDPGDSAAPLPGMPERITPAWVSDGIRFTWLGEDGEYALALGHLDDDGLDHFAAALAQSEGFSMSAADYPMDGVERLWVLPAGHAAVCRRCTDDYDAEDLEDHPLDACGCGDEYVAAWYAVAVTAATPGAIAITRWSA